MRSIAEHARYYLDVGLRIKKHGGSGTYWSVLCPYTGELASMTNKQQAGCSQPCSQLFDFRFLSKDWVFIEKSKGLIA